MGVRPQLWAPHDGGQTWAQVGTHGQRVTDLETVGDRVFAVFATCTGAGAAFASGCTSFTLFPGKFSTVLGWARYPGPPPLTSSSRDG